MTTLAMARRLGLRLGRGLVRLLACGLLPTALHAATPAVALYYGNALPLSDFRAFDIVVVEPDHAAHPTGNARAQLAPTRFYAYVSVTEVLPARAHYAEIPQAWKFARNKDWQSDVIVNGP